MVALRTDRPRDARTALRASPDVHSATLFGDVVHALLPAGTEVNAARGALEASGIEVLGVEEIEASLEDVFIHLVGGTRG
jgi:hypothetical protein